jgi:hypothetical protein
LSSLGLTAGTGVIAGLISAPSVLVLTRAEGM